MEENKNEIMQLGDKNDPVVDQFQKQDKIFALIARDFPSVVIYLCEHAEHRELPARLIIYLGQDKRMGLCAICMRVLFDTAEDAWYTSAAGHAVMQAKHLSEKTINALNDTIGTLEHVQAKIHSHWWLRK